jgi:hypothetical protein
MSNSFSDPYHARSDEAARRRPRQPDEPSDWERLPLPPPANPRNPFPDPRSPLPPLRDLQPTPGVPAPWPALTIPFFPAPTGPNPFPDPSTIPSPRIPPNTIPRGPVNPSPSNPYNDPDFAPHLIVEDFARDATRLKSWLLAALSTRNQSSDEPAEPKAAPAQFADVAPEPASGIRMLSSPMLGTGPRNPTSTGRRRT